MEDIPPTLREKSTWTPKCNKAISDKLFQERMTLLKKWYAAWSKEQRWELVQFILLRLSDDDLYYIYSLLHPLMPCPIPPEVREDFTRLFPRNISLKIFSYLDARSLCRTAQVSWYWRYLTEQNILWKPKCIRYGWFLPTPPTQYNPLTIWKRHYVNCVSNMYWRLPQVVSSPSPPPSPPLSPSPIVSQSTLNNVMKNKKKRKQARRYNNTSPTSTQVKTEWKHPSRYPSDLKKADLFHSPIIKTKSFGRQSISKVESSLSASAISTNNTKPTNTTDNNDKTFTIQVHQHKQTLPLTNRPSVSIDAVLKPPLMEKLRLGYPSVDTISLSTINYPERENNKEVAATLSRVQSNAPFPSLPTYYLEKGMKNNLQVEEFKEDRSKTCDNSYIKYERDKIERKEGTNFKKKIEKEEKLEEKEKESDDDLVRAWREDDFISDSDSELY